ncbi:transposase [Streptomyces sp. NPDC006540]|uniref:transposase n=1 Tax=Streptomyces sp. NPDC006540 TaxID=3155353 RepID=UPI0033BAAF23
MVEPFLLIGERGPHLQRLRDQFNGVVWCTRTGSPWRDIAEVYGAWQAAVTLKRCPGLDHS